MFIVKIRTPFDSQRKQTNGPTMNTVADVFFFSPIAQVHTQCVRGFSKESPGTHRISHDSRVRGERANISYLIKNDDDDNNNVDDNT